MFAVTLRFAAGLAIGAAAALWLASRREPTGDDHVKTTEPRTREQPSRQRFSDYRPDVDGRVEDGALIDGAVEDTFPASDPPAFMQAVVIGTPSHEEAATIQRRQRHKRADEDAFAE